MAEAIYDYDSGESGLSLSAGQSATDILIQPPGSGKSVIVDSLTLGLGLSSRSLTSGRLFVALGHGNPATNEFVQHGPWFMIDFAKELTKTFPFPKGMETGFGTGKALKYRALSSVTLKAEVNVTTRVETTIT